ncbi:MAG: hypothetical protein AAF602_05575 [Myxococcota bacterium]
MSEGFHQFPAVVELAVVPITDGDPPVTLAGRASPLADRARAAVARVGRSSLEIRDALQGVLEAVSGLERTMSWLTGSMMLSRAGIDLRPELVWIGEGAIDLQRTGPWPDGQPVMAYVVLELRDACHLLALQGTVEQREHGARIALEGLRTDERDLIVAYVFQQEAKERRRALDDPR